MNVKGSVLSGYKGYMRWFQNIGRAVFDKILELPMSLYYGGLK
ncbi:MAG: hypothetical protein SPI71_03535 [Acidaminococcaceae bacterium]|nr:hypothetical protein [Acidaminococcaceae bacterium]